MKIICESDHPTIQYAAAELARCLGRTMGKEIEAGCCGEGIRLGLMSEFPEVQPPKVADPVLDDAIFIHVTGGVGIIAGINPRSVLLAVYRYLTELGCRWVRPGSDGEYIPHLDHLIDVEISETPSYRHRGVCIEGAVSVEHVTDMVDWLPKIGFNGYFIQFREGYEFFDRWYSHLDGRHISIEQAREFTGRVVAEIKKRDMLYHGVGHGWTCEPFGMSGLGWSASKGEPPAEAAQYLAQVNGERKLWGGVALNTNLCYGNATVREIVTDEIVDYSAKHPEIDIMHFWLADGSNNHCECELCRDTRPSDLYIRMLNELDAKLTAKGLPTRIVFLIYVDLLWPPETEKIANPDRFILMFAPITRTYSEPFATDVAIPKPPPFERNKLTFPRNVSENIGFLRAWQKSFPGDSFDFDYHMMWDHVRDPGYTPISEVLSKDIRGLRDIGIDGYVSCQLQRAFFPTGLPMTVMGRTLWDRDAAYDAIAVDYFASAFGPDGQLAREYLQTISELFDPPYLRGEKPKVSAESAAKLAKIASVADAFAPAIEKNLTISNPCWAKSWFYLKHSAAICKLLASACGAVARDDKQSANESWEATKRYVQEHEIELHPVLDVSQFIGTWGWFFG
jgi:hypothetical protein